MAGDLSVRRVVAGVVCHLVCRNRGRFWRFEAMRGGRHERGRDVSDVRLPARLVGRRAGLPEEDMRVEGAVMPLSNDQEARQRQLANLRRGGPLPSPDNAVSHGAYKRIALPLLNAKARKITEALAADAPVRAQDGSLPAADMPAVRLLADTLCRLDSISAYLERRGWEGEDGKPRPVLDYEARLRSQALDVMKELGMTPASRAKLGLDLARTHRTLEDEIARAGDPWAEHSRIASAAAADDQADDQDGGR